MVANNPAYKQEFEAHGVKIYTPCQDTEYHLSRHIEATRQATYAGAGANEEVIIAHMDAILERCNATMDEKTFKTDCAAIAQALKYRTRNPIDQWCAIRMGCILSFMEGEDPSKCEYHWLQKKEQLAKDHPEFYTFFLTWGSVNVPLWSIHLDSLKDMDYFRKRMEAIASLLPKELYNLSRM